MKIMTLRLCLVALLLPISYLVGADAALKIEWTAINKETARKIHSLTKKIYSSDLNPVVMIEAHRQLVEATSHTPFEKVPGMEEFLAVSQGLYALRTQMVETEKSEFRSTSMRNQTEVEIGVFNAGPVTQIEAKYKKLVEELKSRSNSDSTKVDNTGEKIAISDAREALRQSYRLLLGSLAARGFSQPFNERDLIGTWTWRSSDADYVFTLKADHKMGAKIKPDKPEDWPGGGWVNEGRGKWSVDYNRLSVEMDAVWALAFWKEHKVTWFGDVIKSVSSDTIVLDRAHHGTLKKANVK